MSLPFHVAQAGPGQTPAGSNGHRSNLPAPPPAAPAPRFGIKGAQVDVSGPWSDSYGYSWSLKQKASGDIAGTVNVSGCPSPNWPVSGAVTGKTTFTMTASNPTGGDDLCNAWFSYDMTSTSPSTASGSWTNSVGGSGSVDMTRQIPKPINWTQDGPGLQKPEGVLRFKYVWQSSTGNLADLSDCAVGEKVDYPGASDPFSWPSPPYSGSTPNPTILWVPGEDGRAQDTHSHTAFLKPYQAVRFVAKQAYRYKCPKQGTNDFTGWEQVLITRRVKDSTGKGCFGYEITKSGYSNTQAPMPNIKPEKCAAGKGAGMAQAPGAGAGAGAADLAMSVDADKTSFTLREPVVVDLDLTNLRDHRLDIDLGLDRAANLAMTVRTPRGDLETRTLGASGFGRAGDISLAAGGRHTERLLLNRWYDFRHVGPYTVTLTLTGEGAKPGAERPSATFPVRITGRDPARLATLSQALADQAVDGATFAQRMEAAQALGQMVDPTAVGPLARVLAHGALVETYAIAGLGRIGTPDAVAALMAAAQHHPDPDVRSAARAMLKVIDGSAHGAPQPAD